MTTKWATRIAMVLLAVGCKKSAPGADSDACTTCTDGEGTPTGEETDTETPSDTADYLATPAGEYRWDPDCWVGSDPLPTVYYVHTYTIDGTAVTGTYEMVWVSHPSTEIPVCSFSWPVTGMSGPCDDCDQQLLVRTGDGTNNGCAADRDGWDTLFANSDWEWFVYGTAGDVRVSSDPLDDGYTGTLVAGVLTFVHTQCNGT